MCLDMAKLHINFSETRGIEVLIANIQFDNTDILGQLPGPSLSSSHPVEISNLANYNALRLEHLHLHSMK